jgi:hypothetical protein
MSKLRRAVLLLRTLKLLQNRPAAGCRTHGFLIKIIFNTHMVMSKQAKPYVFTTIFND